MSLLWQRFTTRAKEVVIAAQNEAARTGEPYVFPEHLLIGILKSGDSVAANVLQRLGISAQQAQEELERQMGGRGDGELDKNNVTLSPRMKRVLDLAYDESRNNKANYIGTEHLLIGIIREFEGVAYNTLTKLGVDLVAARKEIVAYLSERHAEAPDAKEKQDKSYSLKLPPEFTQMARDAIIAAQVDAARNGDSYISPERVLLGIFKQPAPGVIYLLSDAGIDPGMVQDRVRQRIGDPNPRPIKIDNVKLDASAKKALDYALEESRETMDKYIRPEHLLLGILRIETGPACRTLKELGMDLVEARKAAALFHAHEILGTVPEVRRREERSPAEATAEPKNDDRPVCEMGKFADPTEASAWLNEMAAEGYYLSQASTTQGELWLTVERGRR